MSARQPTAPRCCPGPLLYRLFVTVVELLAVGAKPRRALEAEVVALRHQVAVLRR